MDRWISWVFKMADLIIFTNRAFSSFQRFIFPFSFVCLIALVRISSTVLDRSSNSGHSCLFLARVGIFLMFLHKIYLLLHYAWFYLILLRSVFGILKTAYHLLPNHCLDINLHRIWWKQGNILKLSFPIQISVLKEMFSLCSCPVQYPPATRLLSTSNVASAIEELDLNFY